MSYICQKLSRDATVVIKEDGCEAYHPPTTDEAWKLAERFLNQSPKSKKVLLLTMVSKYKDSLNADYIRFFDDDGKFLIEKAGSFAPSPNVDFNYVDTVYIAYFIRDFRTGELHFPKTREEAWQLIGKLLPRDLVGK